MTLQELAHRLVRPSHVVIANCMVRMRVDILDRLWSDSPDYIPVGKEKDPFRTEKAFGFLNDKLNETFPRVYAPVVSFQNGMTWFNDGTHRFLVFRNGGVETIDVAMSRSTKKVLDSMGLIDKSILQMFDIWDKATAPPAENVYFYKYNDKYFFNQDNKTSSVIA